MPPKKKKPTPIVVGTVSTRSTRRESIVNIEIIPKANKSSAPKKLPRKSPKTPNKNNTEQDKIADSEKTSPEILEILKDWSDDENSQDNSLLSIGGTGNFTTDKNKLNSSFVSVDQQSLIDILEGNHLEPQQSKSIKNTIQLERKQQSLPNRTKFALGKDLTIENLIANVDSPHIEESEIIEECVVEDDSIIIELSEEQMEVTSQGGVGEDKIKELNLTVKNLSATDNKLDSSPLALILKPLLQENSLRQTFINTKNQNQFDIEQKEIVKKQDVSGILQEGIQPAVESKDNAKFPSLCRIDDEDQSITSEDTTSQSMITVQDEDACDINDMQISDNSTNHYEVIEEQVEFDTSEPIIIENMENVDSDCQIEKNNLLEGKVYGLQNVQNIENQAKSKEIVSSNKISNDNLSANFFERPHKSELQEVLSGVTDFPNYNIPRIDPNCNTTSLKVQDKAFREDLLSVIKKGPEIKFLQSSSKSQEMVRKQYSTVDIGGPVETIPISNQQNTLGNDKPQTVQIISLEAYKAVRIKKHGPELQDETKLLDTKSEENTLCQKINELMDISKDSSDIKDFDPASDKLREGIQKMHIEEKFDQTEFTSEAIENIKAQKYKSSLDNIEAIGQRTKFGKCQITMETSKTEKMLTVKSVLVDSQTREGKLDSDAEETTKSHSKKDIFEAVLKNRRRSARRKPMGDDAQHLETDKQKEYLKLQNISDMGPLCSQMSGSVKSGFQEERPGKSFGKGKKIQKKEYIELHKTNNSKIPNTELDANRNKDVKSPKPFKGKSKRASDVHSSHVTKIDIDSESSEAKTSEAEGDSTSNESSHSSNSTNMFKRRAKKILTNEVEKSDKMEVESHLETGTNKSDFDINISTNDNSLNKKSKGTKTKPKKAMTKLVDEEIENMDINLDKPISAPDNIKLQADIDATINEVLRRYTLDDPGTFEECASPKELKSKVTKPIKESKKRKEGKTKKDEKYDISEEVRRSDRIKTILPVKKKSHGLVRSKSEPALSAEAESSDSNSVHSELEKAMPVSPQLNKKYKSKSRAKSSENLQITTSGSLLSENSPQMPKTVDLKTDESGKAEIEARLKSFIHLKENQYKTDRQVCKEAREMICDCYLAEEDIQKDEYGCGEDCLNRLLMIECGYLCQIGDRCTNKRFQKGQFAPVEVFKTEKKGLGLIAAANIPYGEFILEYVGEVLNPEEFDKRAEVYSKDKNIHFYFMSLRADAIIDATMKGNISRFINHSCDPNAETQKWTVNGELRIGFFSTRTILAGEEITFDYKFQRYGKEAQKCYCGAAICRGWLGERPDESEDEDEEDEEEQSKVEQPILKAEIKIPSVDILESQQAGIKELTLEKTVEQMDIDAKTEVTAEVKIPQEAPATPQVEEAQKKVSKRKPRKELLFEDFDQLNEDIEMVVTTGLKNQAHTLKLSRLMVRAKDLDQRKKLLRVLRRGELPCRRLFLDYHGLRLMHGYMIDAQQVTKGDKKLNYSQLEFLQTKLELLQTLAVLPIQNKTMLIESKVLPAVEKWAKNEDLVEDGIDQKDAKNSPEQLNKQDVSQDPAVDEKLDEIKFLASKLLEEWVNLKESFRIPKKQRIEQMKEHEKEANRKFVESGYTQERESSRKNDQRYRSWSRYKSERETNKKGHREDKDKPSAEYLKMSKHERRKLFALQMELKEEERRLKQREMWRQHEMNCMMIGADPRFTAPFDPNKGFQYIWNPSIGQWQALPVPSSQNQGVSGYNVPPSHKPSLLGPYTPPVLNVTGMTGPAQQYPGMQPNIAPMVPGLSTSTITSTVSGITAPIPGITGLVPGMSGPLHGIAGSVPGITQPPLPALPLYPEVKHVEEDPSQVKFAGPIPPSVKLPPKWKCAKDKYGRPYYYHVRVRKSQWEPPPLPEEPEESSDTSSSETSSLSSSGSSSDPDTDDEIDDTKLLMEVRKQMETTSKFSLKSAIPSHLKKEEKDSVTPSPEVKIDSDNEEEPIVELKAETEEFNPEQLSSIDIRLKEQFNLDDNDPPKKKRRIGLCQEIIISPRTEEDRQQFKEDLKRYKATKEKLKRQKDHMLHQAKKKLKTGSNADDLKKSRDKRLLKSTAKSRIKQMEWNDEHAKKIKEVFRSTMATTVVGVLNAYRKPDCKESRITNTEDFKHLARKLTHFVMLKEMKHISTIDELICTDNVKAKAREYIKKYMSKFGEVYQKRHDEPDFKD